MLKGRVSKKWGLAQQVQYSEKAASYSTDAEKEQAKKYTPIFFQTILVREILEMFETIWASRNKDYHALTTNIHEPQSLRMKRMHDKVHSLYAEAYENLTPEDINKLFDKGIEATLEKRPKQLEKWITDAGRVTQKAFEESESLDRHPITDYFPILLPPNNPPPAPPNTIPPMRLMNVDDPG